MKILFILIAIVLMPISVYGAEGDTFQVNTVEGIPMTFYVIDEEKKIAGVGTGQFQTPAIPKSTSGNVTIPSRANGYTVKVIGKYAFYWCNNVTNINIPSEIEEIGEGAFRLCQHIESFILPNCLKSIGNNAFQACTNLSSLTLPNSVISIGNGAFSGCERMTSVVLPNSLKKISDSLFDNCKYLKNIILPECLEEIGVNAFYGCALETVNVPFNVTKIESQAFVKCTSLTSIDIPNPNLEIGTSAFSKCSSLTEVHSGIQMPQNISGLFNQVPSTAVMYVPYGKASAYKNATGWNTIKTIIEEKAKTGDTFNTNFESKGEKVAANFQVVSESPFSVYFGTGGQYAITEASQNDIVIPTIVTGNDETEFFLTGINNMAFKGSSISSIFIPKEIAYIGDFAFQNSISLKTVYVSWRNPSKASVSEDSFDGIPNDAVLYVPAGTKERYESLEPWNNFSQIVESSPISTGDISARFNSQANLPVYIKNTETVEGLQFKLTLPDGVTVAERNDMLVTSTTERTEGMTIMGKKDPDEENSYLFVLFSLDGNPITGTEGSIMNIRLNIASDVELGTYDIMIEDVYMTTDTYETLNPAESSSELTVKDYMLGDVNNDGIINVTDAIGIVNHVLKNTPAVFIEGAADVNQDGIVNVTDAIAVINMILN